MGPATLLAQHALDTASPEFWKGLGAALLCGGAIGMERQLRGRPAGLRTCSLICLGTMIFARLGEVLSDEGGDAVRMAGQIVVGIGFLGAGVIMNRQHVVRGLTSAAVIWLLAALGVLVALRMYGSAFVVTGVVLVMLAGVGALERRVSWMRRGAHEASVEAPPEQDEDAP